MAERRGLHVDTLRVRVPARDAEAGRQAALELVHGLAAQSPELLALAPTGVLVGAVHVRVPAARARGGASGVTGAVSAALSRAIVRASGGSTGK